VPSLFRATVKPVDTGYKMASLHVVIQEWTYCIAIANTWVNPCIFLNSWTKVLSFQASHFLGKKKKSKVKDERLVKETCYDPRNDHRTVNRVFKHALGITSEPKSRTCGLVTQTCFCFHVFMVLVEDKGWWGKKLKSSSDCYQARLYINLLH